MTSWSKDNDTYRLPNGMVRIGYDADKQRYQFHDRKDGSLWEGPEGSQYGKLRRISTGAPGNDARMFSDGNSPLGERRKPSLASSPAPTNFDEILSNVRRERSASEAGLKSSGAAMLGSAIKRSATVNDPALTDTDVEVHAQAEQTVADVEGGAATRRKSEGETFDG